MVRFRRSSREVEDEKEDEGEEGDELFRDCFRFSPLKVIPTRRALLTRQRRQFLREVKSIVQLSDLRQVNFCKKIDY